MTHPVDTFAAALDGRLAYTAPQASFSPFFSNVGLTFDNRPGIGALHLHYNRNTTNIGNPFLRCLVDGAAGPEGTTRHALLAVSHTAEATGVHLAVTTAFHGPDRWGCELRIVNPRSTPAALTLLVSPFPERAKQAALSIGNGGAQAVAELPTTDKRDPDWFFRFALAVGFNAADWAEVADWDGVPRPGIDIHLPVNHLSYQRALRFHANVPPGETRVFRLAFAVRIAPAATPLPATIPPPALVDAATACAASRDWWQSQVSAPAFWATATAEPTAAAALHSLLSNATAAPGNLAGRIALFPSRGRYPCHYFWDAIFQNLGVILFNPGLARDSLRLLLENLTADGKVPQFTTSTWIRPGSSQSPLLGWGCLNYWAATADLEFARVALPALERNTDWWFSARDVDGDGLTECWDPFEIWDDTPRLDDGPIKPVDVNAYLALQMQACAELAAALGLPEKAAAWTRRRHQLMERIRERFYAPDRNLFLDVLVADGRQRPLKTPAAFMPLLLPDFPLPTGRKTAMIQEWLLSPDYFCGPIPFPVVAYDEPSYQHDKWWRGPLWLPIAYLLLEVLRVNGHATARQLATRRLISIVQADGQLHELFDSRTGAGLGAAQQGWTAGLYLRLLAEQAGLGEAGSRPPSEPVRGQQS